MLPAHITARSAAGYLLNSVQCGLCPQPNYVLSRQCGELGSQQAAAILGRLRVCRACMELSPMLRAAHQRSKRGKPASLSRFQRDDLSLPCPAVERSSLLGGAVKRSFYCTAFPNPASGNQIRHTVTSGCAPRYARYIADAAINGFVFFAISFM